MPAFLAKFPQINVSLTLPDRTLDLADEHIDLAVRTGVLSDSTLVATKVGEIRRVVGGSPAATRPSSFPSLTIFADA
ncbi:LysR substrate-binding domain-containing protein [Rhizobium sp. LjRoot258]|uniref:LysR substrate-binding domain-containing protein n=1 Tax=Rhizobium sp. LjRoot258 TaxID=3342299 RepID=UPI003ECE95F1